MVIASIIVPGLEPREGLILPPGILYRTQRSDGGMVIRVWGRGVDRGQLCGWGPRPERRRR